MTFLAEIKKQVQPYIVCNFLRFHVKWRSISMTWILRHQNYVKFIVDTTLTSIHSSILKISWTVSLTCSWFFKQRFSFESRVIIMNMDWRVKNEDVKNAENWTPDHRKSMNFCVKDLISGMCRKTRAEITR